MLIFSKKNINKKLVIKLFVNIITLLSLILINVISIINENNLIININYIRIYIIVFIELSLLLDFYISRNFNNCLPFILLDIYALLLLLIFFFVKDVFFCLLFIIFFPFTIILIFFLTHSILFQFYLYLLLIFMCIYTYVIIPICIRKFLKLYKIN